MFESHLNPKLSRGSWLIIVGTISYFVLAGSAIAYCGMAEESALGPNSSVASILAMQKAQQTVRRSGGMVALRKTTFSSPGCVAVGQGINRVKCTVTASFCVDPVFPGNGGVVVAPQPTQPKPPVVAFPRSNQSCVTYRAKATGNSIAQAEGLVQGALNRTVRQGSAAFTSASLTMSPPQCLFLDDGSNRVRCEQQARLCN